MKLDINLLNDMILDFSSKEIFDSLFDIIFSDIKNGIFDGVIDIYTSRPITQLSEHEKQLLQKNAIINLEKIVDSLALKFPGILLRELRIDEAISDLLTPAKNDFFLRLQSKGVEIKTAHSSLSRATEASGTDLLACSIEELSRLPARELNVLIKAQSISKQDEDRIKEDRRRELNRVYAVASRKNRKSPEEYAAQEEDTIISEMRQPVRKETKRQQYTEDPNFRRKYKGSQLSDTHEVDHANDNPAPRKKMKTEERASPTFFSARTNRLTSLMILVASEMDDDLPPYPTPLSPAP